MSKDMDLAMDAARKCGADLPAASVAQSVLASNLSALGDLDLAAITPSVTGVPVTDLEEHRHDSQTQKETIR